MGSRNESVASLVERATAALTRSRELCAKTAVIQSDFDLRTKEYLRCYGVFEAELVEMIERDDLRRLRQLRRAADE